MKMSIVSRKVQSPMQSQIFNTIDINLSFDHLFDDKLLYWWSMKDEWRGCFYNKIHCISWIVKWYGILSRWEFNCSLIELCRNWVQSQISNFILALKNNFFQNTLWDTLNQEKLGNKANFLFHNLVWDFEPPMKSYGQNSKQMFENVQKNVHSNPSHNFVHNFSLEAQNLKWFYKDES